MLFLSNNNIDVACNLVKLRNRDREIDNNEKEEDQYYKDIYNVDISKLRNLFEEISNGTFDLITDENIETIGFAWFLIAYELGRSHQSIISDLGE